MKGCVLIPTFNEGKIIHDLIVALRRYRLDIIVLDDGSTDNTKEESLKAGATVISNERNLGKGASLRKGFQRVVKGDYDFIVTLDGDGQHHPEDLKQFLDAFERREGNVIVGNRMDHVEEMPYVRWLTNKIMSMLISTICRQYIPDTQCGYRLISSALLKDMSISTSNFEVESEMLIQAAKKNYRITSVPIKTIYEGQQSYINPLVDTIRFCRFLFKDWVRSGVMILREFFNDMVIKHSSIIFISSFMCNILSFIFWLYMVRRLDYVQYGILNSMISFLGLIGLPVTILQTVLARYMSEFQAQQSHLLVQALFRAFLKRILYVSLSLVVILFLLAPTITSFLKIDSSLFVYLSGIYLFATMLYVLTFGTMQGLHLFIPMAVNSILQAAIKFLVSVFFVFLGLKAIGGFAGVVFATVSALVISFFQLPRWVFRLKRKEYKTFKPEIKLQQVYKYFIPASAALIAYTLFIYTDILLVKHYFSESQVGIYSIAQTVGKIILFFPTSIALVFFPVSVDHVIRKKSTLPLLQKALFFIGTLSVCALIFTFVFPRLMLRLVAGRVIAECVPLVRFLIFPMSIFSIVYIFIFYNLSLHNTRFIKQVFALAICQIIAIIILHRTLYDVVGILLCVAVLVLISGIRSIRRVE